MATYKEEKKYYQLVIQGNSPEIDIWLGDDEGHFVQKAQGELRTSLLEGKYIGEFGLGSKCYPINLNHDTWLTQNEIETGPTCERPKPNISK